MIWFVFPESGGYHINLVGTCSHLLANKSHHYDATDRSLSGSTCDQDSLRDLSGPAAEYMSSLARQRPLRNK